VELLIWLTLLYALQCVAWLPRGAELFVRPIRRWVISRGPGWRLVHPLPSGDAALALRFPLSEREGRLRGRGATTWLSGQDWGARSAPVDLAALGRASAQGSVVRVDGRPFARGWGPAHAESLAQLLRELAGDDPGRQRERLERSLAESLSYAGYEAARAKVDAATYWLGIFALLPVCIAGFGEEPGILRALPILAVLHLATLVALASARRSLRPWRTGALIESLVVAGCYPPLLLREHHTLRTQELASFHPAVVASSLLPEEDRRAYLRAELARASMRPAESPRSEDELGLADLEHRALLRLTCELGESPEALLAPPARCDPAAAAYCPACLCEYRRATGSCSDCDLPLRAFRGEASV